MSDDARRSATGVPGLAPEEEHLAGFTIDGTRRWIDPITSPGRFLRARTIIGVLLIALFLALPHVTLSGQPAILLDLANRRFTFFGTTLHPTDNLILLAFGATVVVSVFLFTTIFGRVWCGYGCPQTVYMELVFRPIETLVEGKATERRKRDAGGWTSDRLLRKAAKWAIYLVVALVASRTFISYFSGWDNLWPVAGALAEQRTATGATAFVTALMFVDFAFFREQMCTLTCPYGRFQSVLFDRATKIIAYDTKRGEPRGKLRSDEVRSGGDCIDCNLCVQTCPTGIDIRKGLQMECVACAQCVDACDTVMHKINQPKGLIRYGSLEEMEGAPRKFWRPRVVIYLGLIAIVASILTTMLGNREPIDVTFVRTRATPYRETASGAIECPIQIHISNRTADPLGLKWSIRGTGELEGGDSKIHLGGFASQAFDRTILLPRSAFHDGRAPLVLVFELPDGTQVVREKTLTGPLGEAPAADPNEQNDADHDDDKGETDHSDHDGDKR